MRREVELKDISDGRLFRLHDKLVMQTRNCEGCNQCCTATGDSIVLDPYDCALLCSGLQCSFDELMERCVGLRPVDGLILPYLKKTSREGEERCVFLDAKDRCQVHPIRPGFCRLFPLGRIYDGEKRDFSYFLQIHECPHLSESAVNVDPVSISDWLELEQPEIYEAFICSWHFLTKDLEQVMLAHPEEEFVRNLCMAVINLFYRRPYGRSGANSFYEEFDARVAQMREIIE